MKKASLVLFSILLLGVLGCEALNTENKKANSDDKIVKEDEEVKSLYTIDSYMKSVEENLEAKSETLISNIKELHKYNIYSKVELLDFVAFVEDPSEFNLSITMFSMDRQANEVFNENKDSSIFAGSLGMIENVRYTHLLGNQTDDFWDFYEKNEEELNLAEKQAFATWVADCWKKADGQAITLPAYFSLHDDYESFDLRKNQWVTDDEKWSY
ncbi:hypothetical protein [Peribacillus frigoritolerans]|uniref:hypothetical protein n=1 Tax=Peribacillus frigoritolerans TaxID=450367 RepID=UPI002E1BBFBB|nr:hypothetical protein [Peribacillus frigoritolerans]MED3847909.1 hypothetical protein [Peribacillus frigoritolerans]WVN09040.1 hypothetical protein V2I71_15730 [Peribacillus frigoritolerans]